MMNSEVVILCRLGFAAPAILAAWVAVFLLVMPDKGILIRPIPVFL